MKLRSIFGLVLALTACGTDNTHPEDHVNKPIDGGGGTVIPPVAKRVWRDDDGQGVQISDLETPTPQFTENGFLWGVNETTGAVGSLHPTLMRKGITLYFTDYDCGTESTWDGKVYIQASVAAELRVGEVYRVEKPPTYDQLHYLGIRSLKGGSSAVINSVTEVGIGCEADVDHTVPDVVELEVLPLPARSFKGPLKLTP